MSWLVPASGSLPALFVPDQTAGSRFIEFFAANIRDPAEISRCAVLSRPGWRNSQQDVTFSVCSTRLVAQPIDP